MHFVEHDFCTTCTRFVCLFACLFVCLFVCLLQVKYFPRCRRDVTTPVEMTSFDCNCSCAVEFLLTSKTPAITRHCASSIVTSHRRQADRCADVNSTATVTPATATPITTATANFCYGDKPADKFLIFSVLNRKEMLCQSTYYANKPPCVVPGKRVLVKTHCPWYSLSLTLVRTAASTVKGM